jgi:TPR repeat protein/transposase-like protein
MSRDKDKRAVYTPELKLEAVRRVQGGQSKAATARLLGIPESTLRNWLRDAARLEINSVAAQPQIEMQGEQPALNAAHQGMPTPSANVASPASASTAAWWVIGGNLLFLIGSFLLQEVWLAKARQAVAAAQAVTADTHNQKATRAPGSAAAADKARDPQELIAAMNRAFAEAAAAYEKGDYASALRLLQPLAGQGHARAQNQLGILYDRGLGVAQDHAEAMKWYRRAADAGDAGAQNKVGTMYAEANGAAQDFAEAAKWYRKAADQGFADAQYSLGVMYDQGVGVAPDPVQAHKWFSLAAAGESNTGTRATAMKTRDSIAAEMSPEQLAEAEKLAREWKRK